MPTVRAILRESASSKYDFSAIVLGIVKSAPFQNNMKITEAAGKRTEVAINSDVKK